MERARALRTGRARAARQTQAVDLADDGIARDPAQDPGDLARGKPFIPKGFQLFHAFIGPTHRGPQLSLPQDIVPDRGFCTTTAVPALSLVHNRIRTQCPDRRVISGIIFVIRNGLRWRDAPKEYGPHKTIYNRFIRWSRLGVFNRIFAELAAEGGRPARLMIDATHLKAHRTAASLLKKRLFPDVSGARRAA